MAARGGEQSYDLDCESSIGAAPPYQRSLGQQSDSIISQSATPTSLASHDVRGASKLPGLVRVHMQREETRLAHQRSRVEGQSKARVKDCLYQSSFALWKHIGSAPLTAVTLPSQVSAFFRFNAEDTANLRCMAEAVIGSGAMDVKTFLTRLKETDKESSSGLEQQEARRFQAAGIMDHTIQKVIRNPQAKIAMSHPRPENELGKMTVNPPYGVLGDTERMNALISSHLDLKYDTLRDALVRADTEGRGRVTRAQFSQALRSVAHYLFESELQALITVVDPKNRGYIYLSDFLGQSGVGMQYLKRKSDRSALQGDPLVWSVVPVPPRTVKEKRKIRALSTKASRLRVTDSKHRIGVEAARNEAANTAVPRRPPPRRHEGPPVSHKVPRELSVSSAAREQEHLATPASEAHAPTPPQPRHDCGEGSNVCEVGSG